MPITSLSKHDTHDMQIHLTRPNASRHWAALRCQQCNTHIQWLSQQDTQTLVNLGVSVSPNMFSPKRRTKMINIRDLGL